MYFKFWKLLKIVEKKVWVSNQVLYVSKTKKLTFIAAFLKLETLLFQNMFILFYHILYL
jgi:hypothetical protein